MTPDITRAANALTMVRLLHNAGNSAARMFHVKHPRQPL